MIELASIKQEDFINYRKPSMFLGFPHCSFKCGRDICQNVSLVDAIRQKVDVKDICQKFLDNPITEAMVFGGLEPFDSWEDILEIVRTLRNDFQSSADIVIYTGYYKSEIPIMIKALSRFENIIVKFGRYIPNEPSHFDELLGVELASSNQYAMRL